MAGQRDQDALNPESRLFLRDFRVTMRKYLVALSEAFYSLQEIYASLFDENLTIHPVNCKEAIQALEEMYGLVQKYNTLLDDSSYLPIATLAPRYRLLFTSHLVLDQTRRLIDLFSNYRVICLSISPQSEQMRKNIQLVFQTLLKHIADIPRQELYLEEESRSIEQELLSTPGDG